MAATHTSSTGSHQPTGAQKPANTPKHVHHGRTPAAWAGTITTSIAFVIGAIGLVTATWPVFWFAVVVCALGVIAALVLQKTGHGAY